MRQSIHAVRRALRVYTPLKELVGVDGDGEVKVYSIQARSDSQAPYVVLQYPPNDSFERAYGDDVGMERMSLMSTAWASNLDDALQIADAVDDALTASDFDVSPYEVVSISRVSNPRPRQDLNSNLAGTEVVYEMTLAH